MGDLVDIKANLKLEKRMSDFEESLALLIRELRSLADRIVTLQDIVVSLQERLNRLEGEK
jgi:hypothetical protein